jgi:hypothetical protein
MESRKFLVENGIAQKRGLVKNQKSLKTDFGLKTIDLKQVTDKKDQRADGR